MEKVLTVVDKNDVKNDFEYWKTKSPEERIDSIEILRLQYIKLQENVQQGLQRVYKITKQKSGWISVIGGYAVWFHGHPRYTGDIDIWLNPTKGNIGKIPQVLNEFGFKSGDYNTADFKEKDNIIRIGFPPFRIDLMVAIDGVLFETCYPNRVDIKLEDVMVHFIGLADLIKNKKACNRKKDQLDLENLSWSSDKLHINHVLY